MPQLIPVDHDPFADVMASGDPEAAGAAAASTAMAPAVGALVQGAGEVLRPDTGPLVDLARGGLARQADLAGRDWSQEPLIGVNRDTGELTGRIPAFAQAFNAGLAGPVPGGALGAGPAILRRAGRLAAPAEAEAPLDAALDVKAFANTLRDEHLARDGGLPLSGAQMPVTPPPHIRNADDMANLVNHYADLGMEGEAAKNWYLQSGQAIAQATNDLDTAGKFTSAIARTSPQTDVASNLTHAITLHNQAMLGEPLRAGRFPQAMGPDVERYYYGNDPVTGEKIAPFHNALDVGWNPDFPHTYVNDVWNMRALQYPGEGGKLYDGTPTLGQHNFTRIAADRALDEIEARTGQRWDPKELQAASWAAIKSRTEGAPLDVTAQNYADGLARNYAQASWESAPGETSNHLPEYHTAPMHDRQAFHDEIRSVLTDDQGNDVIHRHLGLLTGPSFDAPGVFGGQVNPGTQAQVALGQAPGGWKFGVDPASKDLMNSAEAVRGLLLRQDASAWHKPAYAASLANKDLSQVNLADIRVGRPLTMDEAGDVAQAMKDRTGQDFAPIATPQGYRLMNDPDKTGLSNRQFMGHVRDVVASDLHPEAGIVHSHADGNYIANDWQENPGGEDFIRAIRGTGRPDVQRAAAELLATLGPRIQQVEERWAQTHGWTPNRETRPWDNPVIERYGDAVVPNPPRPWIQRPAPQSSGPPLFSGAPAPSPAVINLHPVDHDPFNPLEGGA